HTRASRWPVEEEVESGGIGPTHPPWLSPSRRSREDEQANRRERDRSQSRGWTPTPNLRRKGPSPWSSFPAASTRPPALARRLPRNRTEPSRPSGGAHGRSPTDRRGLSSRRSGTFLLPLRMVPNSR